MGRFRSRFYTLLRWSERYVKTDMVFVFLTSYWSVVAQIMTSVAGLLVALVVARIVAKTEYGDYQYVLSVIGTLSIFSLSGLGNAVLQSVARGFDQSLPDGFWLNLRWSFGVALGALCIGGYYFYHGNGMLGFSIIAAGLISPLTSSLNLYGWFLNGKKDVKRSSLYPNGIGNVIPMLGIIAGALIFRDAAGLIFGYVIINLLTAAFLYWRTIIVHPLNDRHDSGLRRYGLHLSLAGVLNTIGANLDNILLFHFVGGADVAIYNFSISIVDQTKGPFQALSSMMTARFSGHTHAAVDASMKNKMLWLLLAYLLIIAIYIPLAPFIYHILFPAYASSIFYSQVYVFSLLAGVFTPAGVYLSAHKLVREVYISSIASAIFQIASLVVGAVLFGVWGVLGARMANRFFGGIVGQLLYWYIPLNKSLPETKQD